MSSPAMCQRNIQPKGDCNRAAMLGGVSFVPMAKILTIRATPRRRGNPNWGKPVPSAPILATEFEKKVQQLGLTKQAYADSGPLQIWCKCNKNRCFIPEWLLEAWGIVVEDTFSGTPVRPDWQMRSAAKRSIA